MIRAGRILRSAARGTAKVVGGSAALGATGVAIYVSTEQGKGMKRELEFWSGVAPVVFDYYWNFAESSPYVKYQKMLLRYDNTEEEEEDENQKAARKALRKQKMKELHQRHAPEILDVLLDLKGLYVKLGQVLSVTALPIPEAYREKFRTLQSDVPGWEEFEDMVKPTLERELGRPLEEVFASIDPVPCGAASIGQAHKAVLHSGEQVIVKVQYPDAGWQVPADIQCVEDLMKICVFFGVIDESAANMSFNEFSRQFLSELDYNQERQNLQDVYQSSLDPSAPYQRRRVLVPSVHPEWCTSKVITMSYLPGPKLEEEARRQLEALGINTKKGIRGLVKAPTNDETIRDDKDNNPLEWKTETKETTTNGWKRSAVKLGGQLISADSVLGTIRVARRVQVWCTAITVQSIDALSALPMAGSLMPSGLVAWAQDHSTAFLQAKRLAHTKEWVDALFDVHAHQIFNLGCFNADCHPGNILVVDEDTDEPKLGLIDFGQCKRLTEQERAQVARLLVSVANQEPDESIAAAFRVMGVQTRNDNTEFLAKFAKLMFGPLESHYLDHAWHKEMQRQDSVTYFPNQLSMVYRTSMLLRGLAVSLQFNVCVGDLWKDHAQEALDRYNASALTVDNGEESALLQPHANSLKATVVRRITATDDVVKGLQDLTAKAK